MQEYSINDIILSDELYMATKEEIMGKVRVNFESRKDDVKVVIGEGQSVVMSVANLLTNLIVWNPFNAFKVEVTPEFILDANSMSKGTLDKFFNSVIEHFSGDDYTILAYAISSAIEEMSDISGEFNVRIGNSTSVFSLIEHSKRNPELYDLLMTNIPPNLQFIEIEDYLKERTSELMKILSGDGSVFADYINSKTGINVKQLSQTIMNVGLKPDLYGNVIPEPIDTSYLRGLRNVQDFYINALGARKALITNFNKVKESGYLTRKLSLLMIDTVLDYDVEDCGSHHLMRTEVKSKDTLNRIGGRWVITEDDPENYLLVTSKSDIIGKTVWSRSPITCCNPGGKICRTCYGDNLAKLNKDYHVGILAVLLLTNQLTQMLLSAKHLLQTKSSKIDFQPEFLEYFTMDRNMIMLNTVDNSTLIIDTEDMEEDEENDAWKINTFKIRKMKGKTATIVTDIDLILTSDLLEVMDEHKGEDGIYNVPIRVLNPDSVVFNIVMENNELSASLQSILELIETNSHLGLTDVHEIYNTFIDLLNESGIAIDSVHIELILRSLIRDVVDPTQTPDFTQDEFPIYRILRVTDAILKSPSVSVSLAFEQIKKQIETPETYFKNAYSLVDELL